MFISSSGFPHQFLQRWPGSSAALRSGAQRAEGFQEGSPPRLQCGVTAPSQDVKISKGTRYSRVDTGTPWHFEHMALLVGVKTKKHCCPLHSLSSWLRNSGLGLKEENV